jgi:hypothetical protein
MYLPVRCGIPGLVTSLNAAYTVSEITELLRHSKLRDAVVTREFFGLCIAGQKGNDTNVSVLIIVKFCRY